MRIAEKVPRKTKLKKTKLEKLFESQAHMKDPNARPIWEIAEMLGAQIPAEELARIPKDAAKNYKHYLYGHPKEEE
jgi:hypothetical protein